MDTNNRQQNIILPEEEGIDIKKYIFLIFSHWWLFAITIFLALTIVYLVNRYSEKIYVVSCSVIVEDQESQLGSVENMLNELSRVRNRRRKATVENEISILKSYNMARCAINELEFNISYTVFGRRQIAESKLYKNSPFVVALDTTRQNVLGYPVNITILSNDEYRLEIDDYYNINQVQKFGEPFIHENFNFTVLLKQFQQYEGKIAYPSKYYFKINNINSLANQYRNALNITVNDEKGSILTLSLQGPVSEQMTDYLNKLCEVYIRSDLEEKNAVSENTIQFINEQLNEIIDSLQSAELRLQNFRANNKVIDISREGNYMFQQLEELQSEKAMLDINANYYNYLKNYIEEKSGNSDVIAPSVIGINDQLLNSLVAELNQLNLNKRNISFALKEDNPEFIQLRAQIESLRKNLLENLNNVIEANTMSRNNLNMRINKVERQLQKLPFTERQLINFQREFEVNDQIYTFLLEKRAEAGITKASNTPNNKILDRARPENAQIIKPKKSINYLIGLFAGAGIPFIVILLLDFFNNRITDRKYLETSLKVPIIGNIGHNGSNTELPIAERPGSSFAESFRALRANLKYILQSQSKGVISVTSAISGEGKTFCACNLSCILALGGKKTLLISLDLRRPKVHKVFNLRNDEGMSTYLIGKTTFEELIIETNITNLYVINSGPTPPNPSELIGSQRMPGFIEKVKKIFDFIIIDTPPVAIVTDTLEFKDQLDALFFVIRHNYSEKQVIEMINKMNEKNLIKKIGVIVNDIRLKGYSGYSYFYGYRYGYQYGYSYGYDTNYYNEEFEKTNFITNFRKLFKR